MTLRLAEAGHGWRSFCPAPERLDNSLQAALDTGGVILATSRFSTPTGENARTSAINSLTEALQGLKRQSGIDLLAALPSKEELEVRLRHAPVTRSRRLQAGQDIVHRFVQIDLRPAAPVVILMATGTGRIAAEGFIQPFTQRVATLVWELEPALLVTKRWDRTTRNDDLVGPLFLALNEHRTWVCTDRLFREMNDETRLLLMVESFAARSNTGGEDRAKRLGQADRTGRTLDAGRVAYHLPSAPAPGMGLATLKRRPNLAVEKVAYLDMPGCRPPPSRVADGLSEVVGEDGQIVDQVANVRFFLSRYGDPDWMTGDRLLKEMSRRRFSTVHVRSLYGADAYVTMQRGYTSLQSILDNLDVYETGVLRREVGGDIPAVEITDVLPPDGPWATAQDFARIRAHRARGKARAGAEVRLALSAIRATYDGVVCRTRSVASPSTLRTDEPCLQFKQVVDRKNELRVPNHVLLPWAAFAESVADGIISAGSQALQPLLDRVAATEEANSQGLEFQIAECDEQLRSTRRRMDGLLAQLGDTAADGTPVLRGAFLAAAQNQYEELERQVANIERTRADLHTQVAAETSQADGADPALLPRLLASLRDPNDQTYLKLWPRIITSLAFTTAPSAHPGKNSRMLRWQGAIKLDAGPDGTVIIPFQGSYDYRRVKVGRAPRFVERQHEYVAAMLAGTPFDAIELPARHANQPRVARLLGVEDGHPVLACEDPRIVAAATAMLLHDKDGSVALPGEDPGFLTAIRRVHVDDRSARPWRRPYGAIITAFYDLAATTGTVMADAVVQHCQTSKGTVHTTFATLRRQDPNWTSQRKKGYVLAPCRNCHSHDRRPAQIAEITGLLCRACGVDEAGVTWDPDIYGEYLP